MADIKPPKETYVYYKMAPERHEWLGVRYFRVAQSSRDSVTQVCVNPGQERRGRGNTFGIYLISRMTFFSNYLAQAYAIPCTKKEYDKAFDQVT